MSIAVQDIVSKETSIKDVFVYANSAQIKVQIAPVEVFVEMSEDVIQDIDDLAFRMKESIREWKGTANFPHLINLTLIPMKWKFEIGI